MTNINTSEPVDQELSEVSLKERFYSFNVSPNFLFPFLFPFLGSFKPELLFAERSFLRAPQFQLNENDRDSVSTFLILYCFSECQVNCIYNWCCRFNNKWFDFNISVISCNVRHRIYISNINRLCTTSTVILAVLFMNMIDIASSAGGCQRLSTWKHLVPLLWFPCYIFFHIAHFLSVSFFLFLLLALTLWEWLSAKSADKFGKCVFRVKVG